MKLKHVFLWLLVVAAALAATLWIALPDRGKTAAPGPGGDAPRLIAEADAEDADAGDADAEDADAEGEDCENNTDEGPEEEDPVELAVNRFDDLTDRWRDTETKSPPTMADIDEFAARFREVPEERRDECIHRALNLIPDENVMLLAGILMDRANSEETIQTVFHDVLNRDETVKAPIMRQIYEDRTHPCWADVAWIYDATGELDGDNGDGNDGGAADASALEE